MKFINYKKYQGDLLDSLDMENLLGRLADYFLQSGFPSDIYSSEYGNENSLDQLRQAILQALQDGDLFPPEKLQEMIDKFQQMSSEQLQQLADRLI